jgi:hypothetical protein
MDLVGELDSSKRWIEAEAAPFELDELADLNRVVLQIKEPAPNVQVTTGLEQMTR